MANLFPEDDVELEETEILEDETEDDEPNYQPGLQVNDETNDFVLTGSGKIRECDETESWIQWCKRILKHQDINVLLIRMILELIWKELCNVKQGKKGRVCYLLKFQNLLQRIHIIVHHMLKKLNLNGKRIV